MNVLQSDPLLPAPATISMPAARWPSTADCKVFGEQPSSVGQTHELVVRSGALVGSPWLGSPPTGYGARKNSMHSMYRAGVPAPSPMLRQPMHCAPGAMPICLPASSCPFALQMDVA